MAILLRVLPTSHHSTHPAAEYLHPQYIVTHHMRHLCQSVASVPARQVIKVMLQRMISRHRFRVQVTVHPTAIALWQWALYVHNQRVVATLRHQLKVIICCTLFGLQLYIILQFIKANIPFIMNNFLHLFHQWSFAFFFFRRSSLSGRYHLLRLLCCLHTLFKSFFSYPHFVFYLFCKQSFHPGFYNTHNIIVTELCKKSFSKVEKLSNYIFNHGICFWVCAKVQPPKVGYKKSVHFVHFFFIAQKSFMPTLRVFKANGFSSFMFQKLNINDWLSIASTNET